VITAAYRDLVCSVLLGSNLLYAVYAIVAEMNFGSMET